MKKQAKIEIIKMQKEKKKMEKRKLLVLDGPNEIKIDDYIREEKRRIKREEKMEAKAKKEEIKQIEEIQE